MPRSGPKRLRSASARREARVDRDQQWRFTERVAERGTLWFCNWNKLRMPEATDELRVDLMTGMTIIDWMSRHADWFVVGEWDQDRYAMPIQLTDAGRSALADRAPHDMEPVRGGLVEPGWIAVPAPRSERDDG